MWTDYNYHKAHLQKWRKEKLLDLITRKEIVLTKPVYKYTKKELVDILANHLAEIREDKK